MSASQEGDKTFEELKVLAEKGDVSALNKLGRMYQYGEGVTQDYNKALKCYRSATKQEDAEAHFNLGEMHRKKQGVIADSHDVFEHYYRAARRGFPLAQYYVGDMYRTGEEGSQDFVLGHMWLNLAGSNGVEKAIGVRDTLEKSMSSDQIEEAQKWAGEWKPSN